MAYEFNCSHRPTTILNFWRNDPIPFTGVNLIFLGYPVSIAGKRVPFFHDLRKHKKRWISRLAVPHPLASSIRKQLAFPVKALQSHHLQSPLRNETSRDSSDRTPPQSCGAFGSKENSLRKMCFRSADPCCPSASTIGFEILPISFDSPDRC